MAFRLLLNALLALGLGAPFFLLERRFAAHRVAYRQVLAQDFGAYAVVALLGIPSAAVVDAMLPMFPVLLDIHRALKLPPWASIPLAVVGADFALYWTHRTLHTRLFWRVHRWHHAPRHMYWLAGARTSFLQGIVYSIFPLMFVLLNVPTSFLLGYALFATVANHWMHSNLRLKSRWLEAVFVTPRIHHIHHSKDPRHHGRNFGGLFIVWDRMFGTFVDPDDVTAPLEFGIPDLVPAPRIVLGV